VPLEIKSKVCPSGSARATISPATMPPALGLLSTTTDWPKDSESFCATVRAVMSAAPPAALGTTSFKDLLGKVGCAWLSGAANKVTKAMTGKNKHRFRQGNTKDMQRFQ
jgi:hypothetical protein